MISDASSTHLLIYPQGTAVPLEEALYFISKSRQSALLYSSSIEPYALSLSDRVTSQRQSALPSLNILPLLQPTPLPPHSIVISSDLYLNDNAAGMVIFTSGTTSRPKGSVMRRGYIHDAALANVDPYQVTPKDVLLHVLPVHHAAGIGLIFFTFLFGGALIEFKSGSFDPQWTWERWRRGGLTYFSGVPTIYMRMKRYFEQHISPLPAAAKAQYVEGVRQFKVLLCGTQALPQPIASFWEGMRGGRRILSRYGATETGAVLKIRLGDQRVPDGSIGEVTPGVQLKLSDEGEILVKTPQMFSGYVN